MLLLLVGAWLGGCALPAADDASRQTVVPISDVAAVSLFREGLNYTKRGRLVDAELKLRQALWIYPKAGNIQQSLAAVLARNGNEAEALRWIRTILAEEEASLKKVSPTLYVEMARLSKTPAQARLNFYKAIELAQDTPELLSLTLDEYSRWLLSAGDHDEALCASHESFLVSPTKERSDYVTTLLTGKGSQQLFEEMRPTLLRTPRVKLSEVLFLVGNAPIEQFELELTTLKILQRSDVTLKLEVSALEELLLFLKEESITDPEILTAVEHLASRQWPYKAFQLLKTAIEKTNKVS